MKRFSSSFRRSFSSGGGGVKSSTVSMQQNKQGETRRLYHHHQQQQQQQNEQEQQHRGREESFYEVDEEEDNEENVIAFGTGITESESLIMEEECRRHGSSFRYYGDESFMDVVDGYVYEDTILKGGLVSREGAILYINDVRIGWMVSSEWKAYMEMEIPQPGPNKKKFIRFSVRKLDSFLYIDWPFPVGQSPCPDRALYPFIYQEEEASEEDSHHGGMIQEKLLCKTGGQKWDRKTHGNVSSLLQASVKMFLLCCCKVKMRSNRAMGRLSNDMQLEILSYLSDFGVLRLDNRASKRVKLEFRTVMSRNFPWVDLIVKSGANRLQLAQLKHAFSFKI